MYKLIRTIQEWKPLIYVKKNGERHEFENYLISNLGFIKNISRDRILNFKPGDDGYYQRTLVSNLGNCTVTLHRAVACVFLETDDYSKEVNHKYVPDSKDKSLNSVHNLEWVTPYENVLHARENDLFKSSFTLDQIHEICGYMTKPGWTIGSILTKFNYPPDRSSSAYNIIYDMAHRGTYKPIQEKYNIIPPKDPRIKTSIADIHKICQYLKDGLTVAQIKNKGYSHDTVADIKRKKTWKKVSNQYF